MLIANQFFLRLICLAANLWVAAAIASGRPTAISDPLCPAYPPPKPGTCGPFTFNRCDSNTVDCPFQKDKCASSSSGSLFITEPVIPKDVYVSPEAYVYFKMLETEYLVEFAQNPMRFEKPISLPFCGRPKTSSVRRGEEEAEDSTLEMSEEHLEKRGGLKDFFGKKPPGGTLGKILDKAQPILNPIIDKLTQDGKKIIQDTKTAAKLAQEVINGIAHIGKNQITLD